MKWPWDRERSPKPERREDPVVRAAREEEERTRRWFARVLPAIDPNDLTDSEDRPWIGSTASQPRST